MRKVDNVRAVENRSNDDPLQELVVEVSEVDKHQLVNVLKKYVRLNSRDGKVILQESFNDLTTRNKVFAYMLGCKVSVMLDLHCSEIVCEDQINKAMGSLRGTLTAILVELKTQGLITRSKLDGYYISDVQATDALKELEDASVNRDFDPRFYLLNK